MVPQKLMWPLAVAGFLCVLPLAWAKGVESGMKEAANAATPTHASRVQLAGLTTNPAGAGLQPREPLPPATAEYIALHGAESESLLVKFADDVLARAESGRIVSRGNVSMQSVRQIAAQFGLTPSPYFAASEAQIRALTSRAEKRSGVQQPDLAGILRFRGAPGQVQAAALAFQALEIVEFIDFEESYLPAEYPHLVELAEEGLRMREKQRAPQLEMAQNEPRQPHAWQDERIKGEQQERAEWLAKLRAEGVQIDQINLAEGEEVGLPGDRPHPRSTLPKLKSRNIMVDFDSGIVVDPREADHPDQSQQVIWSQIIAEPGAPWIRLYFGQMKLGGDLRLGKGSVLTVTSLQDGSEQVLDANALQRWNYTSAYFNGDRVLVQLRTYPGDHQNRVHIHRITAGEWLGGVQLQGGGIASPCGGVDERKLSCCPGLGGCTVDPDGEDCIENIHACATSRIWPIGCTGFLFNDNTNCMLTAGHCVPFGADPVAQFNVPCSLADGTPQHPPATEQYPVVDTSIITTYNPCISGCDQDWAYFRVDDNTDTGLSPFAAQGYAFPLAPSAPPALGQMIQIIGYGNTVETALPLGLNQVLKEHDGPLVVSGGSFLGYQADSTGGNSGGPVVDLTTGMVIGIHTCGGCGVFGGFNIGTAVHLNALQHGLANLDCPEVPDFGATGACCAPADPPAPGPPFVCLPNVTQDQCIASSGTFLGPNVACDGPGTCIGFDDPMTELVCCLSFFPPVCEHTDDWFDCVAMCGTPWAIVIEDEMECPPEPGDDDPCEIDEPECGNFAAGPCFSPNPTPFCNDGGGGLCDAICQLDPFCCDEDLFFPGRGFGHWDQRCALHARIFGGGPMPNCTGSFGDCYQPGLPPGCNDPGCCWAVCSMDPECCNFPFGWDSLCVQHAEEICVTLDPFSPTPDMSAAQGYLTPGGYIATHGHIPNLIAPAIFTTNFLPHQYLANGYIPQAGWGGEGFDLDGLWELGEFLLGEYGLGGAPMAPGENLTRGKTMQIAVLATTAFVHPDDEGLTHESLRGTVTYGEPDQTQFFLPNSQTGLLNGHLGTAVLGIIGANGVGLRGMSPDADLYYYPTISVEQGGRFQSAMISAMNQLEEGDVLVVPYTPRVAGSTFASQAIAWLLLNLATNLGISSVVAAGDFCDTMPAQSGGDAGIFMVGGVTPGAPFYRHGLSSFCASDQVCSNVEAVHVAAWGGAVAAPGFGDLFFGEPAAGEGPMTRTYTRNFAGTAPATAMMASVIANLTALTKQFYGEPVPSWGIRGEIGVNAFPQGGFTAPLGAGPPYPGPGPINGIPTNCYGDWNLGLPASRVGSITYVEPQTNLTIQGVNVMADMLLTAEWLMIAGFFDGPVIPPCLDAYQGEEVYTVRGKHVEGELGHVCFSDGILYQLQSEGTNATSKPSFKPPGLEGPLSKVSYRSAGHVADVLLVGSVENPAVVIEFGVVTFSVATTNTIKYIEVYDFVAERWQWGAVQFAPGFIGTVLATQGVAMTNPQRFFNDDGVFLVRLWAYGFNEPTGGSGSFGSGVGGKFEYFVDLIDVEILNIGDVPGGGNGGG